MYPYSTVTLVLGLCIAWQGSARAAQVAETGQTERSNLTHPPQIPDHSQNSTQVELSQSETGINASRGNDGETKGSADGLQRAPDKTQNLTGHWSDPNSIQAKNRLKPKRGGFPPPQLWHAGVYSKDYTPYMQICSGTLVTRNAVISAAHCFWSDGEGAMLAARFAVGAGKRYRPWDDPRDKYSLQTDVTAIHIPARYRDAATSFQEDIAVLMLAQAVGPSHAAGPACVNFHPDFDNYQLEEGTSGSVMGWGLAEEDGLSSDVLFFLNLIVEGIEACLNSTDQGLLRSIGSDKICASVDPGQVLGRDDSSGGGMVSMDGLTDDESTPRVPYLRGVVSVAPRDAHALAALTHVRAHRDFLRRHIPDLEAECKWRFPQSLFVHKRFGEYEVECETQGDSSSKQYFHLNKNRHITICLRGEPSQRNSSSLVPSSASEGWQEKQYT